MSLSQTNDETVGKVYYDLIMLHMTLHDISRSSATQTSLETSKFHTFFLPHLPLLLTTQKQHAIYNLRKAFIYVSHLSSFAPPVVKIRYINFGKALVWALDHADHLLHHIHETDELEILKAIKTIFRLVESFCCRELGLDDPTLDHPQYIAHISSNDVVRSEQDPVYHPTPRVKTTSASHSLQMSDVLRKSNHGQASANTAHEIIPTLSPHQAHTTSDNGAPVSAIQPLSICPSSIGSPSDNVIQMEEFGSNIQNNDTDLIFHSSIYIRNNGKHILPDACIKETSQGCHVPFEFTIHENSESEITRLFGFLTRDVRVLYPDNTRYPYIPVQDIRLFNHTASNVVAEGDKLNTCASVEIGIEVYKTLIDGLKEAYMKKFPGGCFTFLTDADIQHGVTDRRVRIKIPVLTDCFARVVHLLGFVERPIEEALGICQHDLFGRGLLKVELVQALEGIRIVISLAGVVVERDWLNYGEKIFELLGSGVVCELEGETQ